MILAVSAILMAGCNVEWDKPEITPYQSSYTISSRGGEFVIPVSSTGVSDVTISYKRGGDAWEVDPETGDMYPTGGWIKLERVINHYEASRALAQWESGIALLIEPNDEGVEREGYVTISSFNKSAVVTIKQGF